MHHENGQDVLLKISNETQMENSKQITIRYVAYFWHFFKSGQSPLHIP